MKEGFLRGGRVYLKPLEEGDLGHIVRWSQDPEIRALTGAVNPMTEEESVEFYQKVQRDPGRVWFTLRLKDSDRVIGEAGLLRMFPPWRTTDLTMIIGEKDCWGQGYGSEAILLLLHHAFSTLKFHRVAVGVVGFNQRALAFYEKAGFKKEGLQRDGLYQQGRFYDFVMMSILEEDFWAKNSPQD